MILVVKEYIYFKAHNNGHNLNGMDQIWIQRKFCKQKLGGLEHGENKGKKYR